VDIIDADLPTSLIKAIPQLGDLVLQVVGMSTAAPE
jgi:hypothetical protein